MRVLVLGQSHITGSDVLVAVPECAPKPVYPPQSLNYRAGALQFCRGPAVGGDSLFIFRMGEDRS